jgi:serine/threonine protein kinase
VAIPYSYTIKMTGISAYYWTKMSPSNTPPTAPKNQLTGLTLKSGWTLVERLDPSKNSTGGTFGTGYRATKGNQVAFVKAIDFVDALASQDPLAELTKLVGIATFEKDVLEYCTKRGMSKVIRYIGHDYISFDGSNNPLSRVSCLIMEAGNSDLRHLVHLGNSSSCAWNLQIMRDVSQAVAQLHQDGIAHQDIKPSNVIAVADTGAAVSESMKVGDLGRVVRKGKNGPFDFLQWPGDPRYSPPERWYEFVPPDWCDAREASDAYMVGSLLVFLFTGATLQALVFNYIPHTFLPDQWAGGFDDDLLPALVDAHDRVLAERLLPTLMPEIADEIMGLSRSLVHPDPRIRGDKRARKQIGHPVGLDRIYQRLRGLALTCEAIERIRSQ